MLNEVFSASYFKIEEKVCNILGEAITGLLDVLTNLEALLL